MITVQKVLFLRNVDLFRGMTSNEIAHVASIAEELIFSAGSMVIREGEMGDSLYVIVDGEVRVHRGDIEFTILKPNDYLGEMSLFDGQPRSASATAITDCIVLRIGQAEFNDILRRHFGAVLAVIGALSDRIRKKEAEVLEARKAATAGGESSK